MSPLPQPIPAATLASPASPVQIAARQATTIVTGGATTNSCPGQYSGGTLAGAIVGTFFGTLLVIYLFSTLMGERGTVGASDVVIERKVKSSRGSGRRHRSRSGGSYASSVRRPSRVYSSRS